MSSGPVPIAQDLHLYTPDQQERIFRMAEAPTTDEAALRRASLDTQTVISKRAQIIQAALFGGCIAAAAVSFWVFATPWGAVFLGLPVMQGIGSIVSAWRQDKDKS